GLLHFDGWASTFGETTTTLEINPQGSGYRARTRFAKFFNLPELMNMFKEVADIKTADQLNLPTPEIIYETVSAKPTELQKEIVQELSKRAGRVQANLVDPSEDNMLTITNDGRKLGLDQRVFNPMLPDDPDSKVNTCVSNIYDIWEETKEDRLTQLLFCDLSTPKPKPKDVLKVAKGENMGINGAEVNALEYGVDIEEEATLIEKEMPFSVYHDIKDKLIDLGVPEEEIAFIHDAKTEVQKKELYNKVRNGDVRVMLGSTSKCGSGMNVQDRLVALHDLDAPWRPGDLRQRSGRIERQGNMNEQAKIFRYVTDSTFDAYLWQTLENKQKFISQIMTSKSPVRSCDDLDESALSYAEIKALCAGNPKIKLKMDLDIEVAKLKLLKASHQSTKYRLEDQLLKYFPESIKQSEAYIVAFEKDLVTLANNTPKADEFLPMVIKGDNLIDKDNAGAALLACVKEVTGKESVEIGSYRGFTMHLSYDSFNNQHTVTLRGAMSHPVALGQDLRGNLTRIDNALENMNKRLEGVTAQLENLRKQQSNAEVEKDKPFPQENELKEKSEQLAQLDAELNMSGTSNDEVAENEPTIVAKSSRPSVLDTLKSMPKQKAEPKQKKELQEER
ncbi:MAG: helicase-related protein, partial [Eubacteriales bacterium]